MITSSYSEQQPTRSEVDALPGITVLDFGTDWCSICQNARPATDDAVAVHGTRTPILHLRIEDGRGRPLGRSFGVKLWPTLIVLKHGREVARIVRPRSPLDLLKVLDRASPSPTG